jgi:hypothetical protein
MSDMIEERPKYDGDWASATPQQRGAHGQAVKQWRERTGQARGGKGAKGQSRMGAGDAPHAAHAADLALLQTIADDQQALPSDRIRAIDQKQRILSRVAAEQLESEHGPLVALRATLDTLPPAERVGALLAVLRADPHAA